ncbi:MAG: hypothetical protein Fur0037_20180 [Planctomycetota bacterium]
MVLHATVEGKPTGEGTPSDPLDFEGGIAELSRRLRSEGLPPGGYRLVVHGGRYRVRKPIVLGPEFAGTAENPIEIQAASGESPVFDGGIAIPAADFAPVRDPEERARLAS